MMLLERFWGAAAQPVEVASQSLFYEVISSVGDLSVPSTFGYAQREALTRDVLGEIVAPLLAAVGIDPDEARNQLGPGGYKLKTNPALQCHIAADDAAATVVAAALGWVFRQEAILVADLRDRVDGRTSYVIIDMGVEAVTYERAHAFFVHAARVAEPLGGGYTAFEGELLFLNMSDLDDVSFAAALRRSAETFEDGLPVGAEGMAEARFVGNDWQGAANGEDYAARLPEGTVDRLRPLRDRHTELVRAHVGAG